MGNSAEYNRKYYEAHKEELRKRHREYGREDYKANRDARLSASNAYNRNHRESRLEYARKWQTEHPGYMQEWRLKRKAEAAAQLTFLEESPIIPAK